MVTFTSRYRPGSGVGLNWIAKPETLRLDLPAWQKYFGFDKNGAYAEITAEIDLDKLTMAWSASRLACSTVRMFRIRNSCGSRPCQVR